MKTQAAATIADKATEFARRVGENALLSVVARDGVYWLTLDTPGAPNPRRTLMAVGNVGWGVRFVYNAISDYLKDK